MRLERARRWISDQAATRALSDVDLAQGYPSFLRLAGIDPSTALLLDPVQPIYA